METATRMMKERGTDVDGTDGECTRGEVSMLRMRCVRIGCDVRLYVDGRVEMLCEEDRRMEIMRVGSKGAEVLGHGKRIACIVPSMDQ